MLEEFMGFGWTKFVAVFAVFIPLTVSAKEFGSLEQIDEMHRLCSGENPGFTRRALTVATIAAQSGSTLSGIGRNAWPENYIAPTIYTKISNQLKHKMTTARTCWGVVDEFQSLQIVGLYSDSAVFQTLGSLEPKKINFKEFTPAKEEFVKLYEQCTPDSREAKFVYNRMKSAMGVEPVLSSYVMRDTYPNVLHPMLAWRQPKTCDDINIINRRMIEAYIKIDILIREKLASEGYVL
jgi:hypothetical protein